MGIAITVPSKAGISDILEAVKKIEYRFFAVVVFSFSEGVCATGCYTSCNKPLRRFVFAVSSRMVDITLSRKASSVAVLSDSSIYPQIAEMTALLYETSAPCRY